MGEAEEGCSDGCSVSLMCVEDGADLDAAVAAAGGSEEVADDGELAAFLYSVVDAGEEQQEEYMDHLVSKESSFCCSPSSSPGFSSDVSDGGAAEPCPSSTAMASSEEWFRRGRRAAVEWIFETRGYLGFSHRTAYLAVSYMDRFCLHRCMERSVMPWAARLLAVACVSLAAKMEEYRAPPLPEFRAGDGGERDFSSVCIRRMELLVLSTLGWRMGHVTPLDYLPCLCSRLLRRDGGHAGAGAAGGLGLVAARAAALIFSAAEGGSVLDYRPSTVAVAAVLAAAHGGAMTREALECKMSSSSSSLSPSCSVLGMRFLNQDDVHACYSAMVSEPSKVAAKKKRPPPPSGSSSGSTGAGGGAYESADDDAADGSKRARQELPPVVGR